MKIAGFKRKYPKDTALRADATLVPFPANSTDAVICTAVAHHLSDEMLEHMLVEIGRVLKPAGRFVFIDPVWSPHRWAGRLLWKYDQGSNPRTAETLRQMVSQSFRIEHQEQFAIYHEYLLCVGVKRLTLSKP